MPEEHFGDYLQEHSLAASMGRRVAPKVVGGENHVHATCQFLYQSPRRRVTNGNYRVFGGGHPTWAFPSSTPDFQPNPII